MNHVPRTAYVCWRLGDLFTALGDHIARRHSRRWGHR